MILQAKIDAVTARMDAFERLFYLYDGVTQQNRRHSIRIRDRIAAIRSRLNDREARPVRGAKFSQIWSPRAILGRVWQRGPVWEIRVAEFSFDIIIHRIGSRRIRLTAIRAAPLGFKTAIVRFFFL